MKKVILFLTIIFCVLSILVLPRMGLALEPSERFVPAGQGISDKCQLTGNCTLDEFVNFLIFRGMVLIPAAGAFALLMFVIGGIYWVISGGNAERVERGKKIMIGAIIGIVIMFGAWLMVKAMEDILGVEKNFRPAGMGGVDTAPDASGGEAAVTGDDSAGGGDPPPPPPPPNGCCVISDILEFEVPLCAAGMKEEDCDARNTGNHTSEWFYPGYRCSATGRECVLE